MSFTRSTTDLKVHQSLSDYPNAEDGLSAEELKKKFDAPAEQLQKDFNKLVSELEDVGAENIGVRQLTDGDETPPNVYAKLLYLLEQIQNAVLAQIPDGTITKAKMNEEYANILAEKNGALQQNLNAEKINGNTDIEMFQSMVKIGSYIGGVEETQTIDVGFKPRAVIVSFNFIKYIDATGTPSRNIIGIIGNNGLEEEYDIQGYEYTANKHMLTDNGFIVNKLKRTFQGSLQYSKTLGLNAEGLEYTYIAFK